MSRLTFEARSSPDSSQYVWAYRVTIENQGRETVRLLSRHSMITNARGELNEVKGPRVVGEQPVLKPGESYEYTSGAPLNTPSGMMGGARLERLASIEVSQVPKAGPGAPGSGGAPWGRGVVD